MVYFTKCEFTFKESVSMKCQKTRNTARQDKTSLNTVFIGHIKFDLS